MRLFGLLACARVAQGWPYRACPRLPTVWLDKGSGMTLLHTQWMKSEARGHDLWSVRHTSLPMCKYGRSYGAVWKKPSLPLCIRHLGSRRYKHRRRMCRPHRVNMWLPALRWRRSLIARAFPTIWPPGWYILDIQVDIRLNQSHSHFFKKKSAHNSVPAFLLGEGGS